jgi:hypothetical protein
MSRALAVAAVAAALSTSWAGAAGASSNTGGDPNLFASVSASGTLLAGTPGTTVTSPSPGQYEVTFGQNVSDCAYVATTVHAHPQAAMTWVAGGQTNPDLVYVETPGPKTNSVGIQVRDLLFFGGHPDDQYFDVAAVC